MKGQTLFKTLKTDNNFELRAYHPILLAKVRVPGPFEIAFKKGGALLSEYCQGDNFKQRKMGVSSPYFLSSRSDGWEVSCLLPRGVSSHDVPRPIVEGVSFEELPHRRVAVIRIHGKSHYPYLMRKSEELRQWASEAFIDIHKQSRIAIYQNPLFPFIRRNEVHFDVH